MFIVLSHSLFILGLLLVFEEVSFRLPVVTEPAACLPLAAMPPHRKRYSPIQSCSISTFFFLEVASLDGVLL